MNDKLLLQKLLCQCQNTRQEAEIELELLIDTLRKQRNQSAAVNAHVIEALNLVKKLESEIDTLAASALDFETLFKHCYDELMYEEKKERFKEDG